MPGRATRAVLHVRGSARGRGTEEGQRMPAAVAQATASDRVETPILR